MDQDLTEPVMPQGRNTKVKSGLYLLAGLYIAVSLIGCFLWNFRGTSLDELPQGNFIEQVDSPAGTYSIRTYVSDGGATVASAVRGELVYNHEKRKSQNIYWNYHESISIVRWLDDRHVRINGITLDVVKDRYDFRLDLGKKK